MWVSCHTPVLRPGRLLYRRSYNIISSISLNHFLPTWVGWVQLLLKVGSKFHLVGFIADLANLTPNPSLAKPGQHMLRNNIWRQNYFILKTTTQMRDKTHTFCRLQIPQFYCPTGSACSNQDFRRIEIHWLNCTCMAREALQIIIGKETNWNTVISKKMYNISTFLNIWYRLPPVRLTPVTYHVKVLVTFRACLRSSAEETFLRILLSSSAENTSDPTHRNNFQRHHRKSVAKTNSSWRKMLPHQTAEKGPVQKTESSPFLFDGTGVTQTCPKVSLERWIEYSWKHLPFVCVCVCHTVMNQNWGKSC